MFKFLINLLNRNKAKKIIADIDKIETYFTLFSIIDFNEDKNVKLIRSLSKEGLYADIVSRYNVCIQKIEKHNKEIQSLSFAYNSLLETNPISDILDNILLGNKEKIEEIYATIKRVYAYVIPDSFGRKKEYDSYKRSIEEIIHDYEIIK